MGGAIFKMRGKKPRFSTWDTDPLQRRDPMVQAGKKEMEMKRFNCGDSLLGQSGSILTAVGANMLIDTEKSNNSEKTDDNREAHHEERCSRSSKYIFRKAF